MPPELRIRSLPPPPGPGWPRRFVAGEEDRDAVLVLAHVDITPRELRALAWARGNARACLRAVIRSGRPSDRRAATEVRPEHVRARLRACGATVIHQADQAYPPPLRDLHDPPGWLFVRGRPLAGLDPAVGMVGARSCSPYGREMAGWIGRGLARAGVPVISGAARGIDAASHRGALEAEGWTVAVLGSGIDHPFPSSSRRLLEDIARTGTVVSEYPPGTPASRHRFPARNRIVAALATAVVVVEGAPGSGSLISANHAMELGRDVLAVPGPVTSPLSAAPHELIQEGAGLIRGPDDVLEALGLGPPATEDAPPPDLPEREDRVFRAVAGAAATADEVAASAGMPQDVVVAMLASLELQGLIRDVGGRYERVRAAEAP
ncbi:MAG TPA: DNA-processing protein DprA [Actinomycetota bacterium]